MEKEMETIGIILDREFDHHSWKTRFAYKPHLGLAKLRSGPWGHEKDTFGNMIIA